jgi:hypothetical protein
MKIDQSDEVSGFFGRPGFVLICSRPASGGKEEGESRKFGSIHHSLRDRAGRIPCVPGLGRVDVRK